uniref:Large ribosomal subunit protein eL6 n=1 Tax=Ascaris suum TaxID=6253 RepID=F1LBZ4_ASCSU
MAGSKVHVPRMRRNYQLAPGVMRFSAARMYAKRGVYAKKPFPVEKKTPIVKEKFIIKQIGGDKNGGTRKVFLDKGPKYLPEARTTRRKIKRPAKKVPLRSSITPGTVLIILAGRHKGKRVVFLKQLEKSGLLLVTGPLKLNSTPLRRIAQAFVIATKTKIDVSGVKIPEHIDDAYFRRINSKKAPKKGDASIFAQSTAEYTVSEQRKADQKEVDTPILAAIKKHPEHKFLFGYMGSRFALGKNQYPHEMVF